MKDITTYEFFNILRHFEDYIDNNPELLAFNRIELDSTIHQRQYKRIKFEGLIFELGIDYTVYERGEKLEVYGSQISEVSFYAGERDFSPTVNSPYDTAEKYLQEALADQVRFYHHTERIY